MKLVLGDTPVEQGAAPAQTLAQKYVGDKSVLAILGPSTSGAVAASSDDVLLGEDRAHLAVGDAHGADAGRRTRKRTPAFFRVVPGDYIQGPTDANFMVKNLNVKKVVLLDFQEPYSVGLADAVEASLKKAGVVDDPPLGAEHDDRLLGVRDEGAERCRHRLLPDAEAG